MPSSWQWPDWLDAIPSDTRISKDRLGDGHGVANQLADLENGPRRVGHGGVPARPSARPGIHWIMMRGGPVARLASRAPARAPAGLARPPGARIPVQSLMLSEQTQGPSLRKSRETPDSLPVLRGVLSACVPEGGRAAWLEAARRVSAQGGAARRDDMKTTNRPRSLTWRHKAARSPVRHRPPGR